MDTTLLKAIKRNPRRTAEGQTLTVLRKTLQELDYEYHDQNNHLVADGVYDVLRDVYNERSKKPYAKVGSKATQAARRVKLPVKMGSMNKIKTGSTGFDQFLSKGPFNVSDKEDGISLQLLYENGVLTRALQRGDGTIGTDSSGVIPSLKVPQRIAVKGEFIVRVEFTMTKLTFERHFDKAGGGEFENARNGAGGLLNRNQPTPAVAKVRCVAHEIMAGKNARVAPSKQFAFLKSLGFDVVPNKNYTQLNQTILSNLLKIRKARSKREIDGLIVAHDRTYSVTGMNPTHAFAFKINDLEASVVCKVIDIEWNESRHGRLVPRIIIAPTRIGGVTVQHFTGHNAFFIEHGYSLKSKKNPPYAPRPINVGAEIRCVRSGDVIPYIVEVVRASRKPSQPSIPFTSDGVRYHKAGDHGDDRKAKSLMNFFTTLEVDGIKRGTIDMLIEYGFDDIKSILTATKTDFEEIPRFGHTKAVTLERNIKTAVAKNATWAKLAKGSSVFGDKLGEGRLVEVFDNIPGVIDMKGQTLVHEIQQLKGFQQLAHDVAAGMPKFKLFLKKVGIKPIAVKRRKVSTSGPMVGMSILFTSVRDKALAEWIVAEGGKLASSAKSANLLIVKDEYASNTKVDYARANNIPVMTVDKFRAKYKVS
jgi:DNA ligase (NAD+)